MNSFLDVAKNLSIQHNVSFNVYDNITGRLVQHHEGHNMATNSMLMGIGHYLLGDGVLNQGYEMLRQWVPKYISLGTMGLYSQDLDADGLPSGIGYSPSTTEAQEIQNFTRYMQECPGFGADGYDKYANNDRDYMGLGPVFTDRPFNGTLVQTITSTSGVKTYTVDQAIQSLVHVIVSDQDVVSTTTFSGTQITLAAAPAYTGAEIQVTYYPQDSYEPKTVDCELISDTFLRSPIEYRKIVTEDKSEIPGTIDVVFSAMISTGALRQFREAGKDYVLITEAGLWSRKSWPTNSLGANDYNVGDNGLLAGYRIAPSDSSMQDMTVAANRQALKKEIIRVGYNQVVQVVWKLQLGSIEEYGGWESFPRSKWNQYHESI